MICPCCKYEDEEFIDVFSAHDFYIINPECKYSKWVNRELTVALCACPKCKTIILNDD